MERTTGCLGWIGAITLGLILGGMVTAVTGPLLGIIATVVIIWGFARVFASTAPSAASPDSPAVVLDSGPVRSLRGTIIAKGSAADEAPAGDAMVALPLIVHTENFDVLGSALGLAQPGLTVLYRDAVTQPDADGVQVAALATLLAQAPKRGQISAAPIGTISAADVETWPQFRSEAFGAQVAMQRTPDGRRHAWLLFRRGALFSVVR